MGRRGGVGASVPPSEVGAPRFLLYVGYFEFRKNMEGLIAGFGRLPAALRAQHQLVFVCAHRPGEAEVLWGSRGGVAGLGPDELC